MANLGYFLAKIRNQGTRKIEGGMSSLKKYVKKIPGTIQLFELVVGGSRKIRMSPVEELKPFAPNVAGSNKEKNRQTVSTANKSGSAIRDALGAFLEPSQVINISSFAKHFKLEADFSMRLGELFTRHGSDKSTTHHYHLLYGCLFANLDSVRLVIEIGIGTNSPQVLSTMGREHRGVGGSLRAWRDFYPKTQVLGFDIDPIACFQESRIQTSVVNQLNEDSLMNAFAALSDESVDLYIDDGLHALDANMVPIRHIFPKIRPGGWLVVEDIHAEAVPFWQVFAMAVPKDKAKVAIIRAEGGFIFLLKKLNFNLASV